MQAFARLLVVVLLLAGPAFAQKANRTIVKPDCSRLFLYFAELTEDVSGAIAAHRLAFNLRFQGRHYDKLADFITQVKDERVQQALIRYLGPAGSLFDEANQPLLGQLSDWFHDKMLEQQGRNPAELADRLTETDGAALKGDLTRLGQMVYDSEPYAPTRSLPS